MAVWLRYGQLFYILPGMIRKGKPSETRQHILDVAFEAIHRDGFATASLNEILTGSGLTKGALYHHFKNKQELGYALIDEVVAEYVETWWVLPLKNKDDPLEALAQSIQTRFSEEMPRLMQFGCPLDKLSQELATANEGYRQRLETLYRHWRRSWSQSLRNGQHTGNVRADIDSDQASALLVASLQGSIAQSRSAQDKSVFHECMGGLSQYLTSLRP